MALILTAQTSFAATGSGLKQAFDEYNYVMQVEGAALDPEKSREALVRLQEELQGHDREEILKVALAGVSDQRLTAEIRSALDTISANKLSDAEASELMTNILKDGYQRGASWNMLSDMAFVVVGFAGMLLLAAGILYVAAKTSNCPSGYSAEDCQKWDDNRW